MFCTFIAIVHHDDGLCSGSINSIRSQKPYPSTKLNVSISLVTFLMANLIGCGLIAMACANVANKLCDETSCCLSPLVSSTNSEPYHLCQSIFRHLFSWSWLPSCMHYQAWAILAKNNMCALRRYRSNEMSLVIVVNTTFKLLVNSG